MLLWLLDWTIILPIFHMSYRKECEGTYFATSIRTQLRHRHRKQEENPPSLSSEESFLNEPPSNPREGS